MMSKDPLPIFQIPDFDPDTLDSKDFYYAGLKNHLATHQFIQKPHKHDFYIIVLFSQGKGTHTVDFQTYAVDVGSVFFLSPGQVHSWELSPDTDGHILFFSIRFYSATFPIRRLHSFSLFQSNTTYPPLDLESLDGSEILNVFEKIHHEINEPKWSTKSLLANYIDILLIHFYRFKNSNTSISVAEKLVYDQYQHLELIIETNYKENREASFYADQMSMSLKQLNSLCKKAVNKTISQLLLDRVILEAKRLLTHSDLTISQLSYELGFEDASYFSRMFKKNVNLTPEQFRNQQGNVSS